MAELDTDYTNEIICPYCGYEHSDSWDWGDSGTATCHSCGKTFEFRKEIEVTYTSWKRGNKS